MDRWRGKNAIVTGAAAGIGAAITDALLKHGINVLALDIQYERMAMKRDRRLETGSKDEGVFHPLFCDVTDENDIERAFLYMQQNIGDVDILVNNAGVTNYTRIIESDRKTFERILDINVLAMADFVHRAVSSMRSRNVEGYIFNINSILGHDIPQAPLTNADRCNGWNLYPASKHATVALTRTVLEEIRAVKAPIRITSISPGLVKTEISKNVEELRNFFDTVKVLEPSDIADALIYALSTPLRVQIQELTILPSQY